MLFATWYVFLRIGDIPHTKHPVPILVADIKQVKKLYPCDLDNQRIKPFSKEQHYQIQPLEDT